jgi:hypothetical protein
VADFKIRKDAQEWASKMEKPAEWLEFDLYYLCAVIGLSGGWYDDKLQEKDARGFVDTFPGDFRDTKELIVSWLIAGVAKKRSIAFTEKKAVHGVLKEVLQPNPMMPLSNEGVDHLNRFSSGGFEKLRSYFDERPPVTFDDLLPAILSHLPEASK